MSDWLSLVGSITIGSLLLLSTMRFYSGMVDHAQGKRFELLAQESTASLMEIIEDDFRRLGSGLITPTPPILANPDTSDITFLADLDEDGNAEVVRYYLSAAGDETVTPNPEDKILYRVVDGATTIGSAAGVVGFNVTLLDETGNSATDLSEVRSLEITLTVESMYGYDGKYPRAVWTKTLTPQNLVKPTDMNF